MSRSFDNVAFFIELPPLVLRTSINKLPPLICTEFVTVNRSHLVRFTNKFITFTRINLSLQAVIVF